MAASSYQCLRIIILLNCYIYVGFSHTLSTRHEKSAARANSGVSPTSSHHTFAHSSSSNQHLNRENDDFLQSLDSDGFQNDNRESSTGKNNGHHHQQQQQQQQHLHQSRIDAGNGKKGNKPPHHMEKDEEVLHHPHRHKDSSALKQSTVNVLEHMTSRSRMSLGLTKGLSEIKKANEHYLKVHHHARCKVPKSRVVKVKELYPDPSKEYLPSCTLLHRCGDDAGCCESDAMQCVAKKRETVELHFYKLNLGNMGDGVGVLRGDTVEILKFYNDTECECQPMDERPRFHFRKTGCLQCPSEFTLREISKDMGGGCSCDCFDKQKSCIKIKRGREQLPELDRRCVDARRCHPPECEYGLYDHTMGRCPKKTEKKNHSANNNHYDNWWRFDGRE